MGVSHGLVATYIEIGGEFYDHGKGEGGVLIDLACNMGILTTKEGGWGGWVD